MIIAMIVAAAENNVIGKDNKMLWHMPADLKYFKSVTLGRHVLMGRKTFEALGRLLPGRTHVIITRQKDYSPEGAIVTHSIQEALKIAEKNGETEAMILGGGDIYKQALPIADKIYLTRIHSNFEGDTIFPELDPSVWKENARDAHQADEKNPIAYTFLEYHRR